MGGREGERGKLQNGHFNQLLKYELTGFQGLGTVF